MRNAFISEYMEFADLVSEIIERKPAFKPGIKAQHRIDFHLQGFD